MSDIRWVPDRWRRLDVTVRDLPLALLVAVISFVPGFQGNGTKIVHVATRPYDALALSVIVLLAGPLAIRRRWPALSLALVVIGFSLDQLLSYHTPSTIALPIALLSTGAHLARHRLVTALLLTAAYVPLAVALDRLGPSGGPGEFVTFYLALAVIWGGGAWLRSTRAAEAERRRRVAEATRAAERARIARELHDVVTHHVTAMVVQAEAARYLTADPERLEATLNAVTSTGRRAIADLRHLLDLLNPDHDEDARMPSVGELKELIEQTREAGQPVEFTENGEPAETTGSAEWVAYRVVQESLTNALKYAHGSRTAVDVCYGDKEITVEVTNDGSGSRTASPGGSGRGLVGLRERVEALGGDFCAEPTADGGFAVRARIPACGAS